MSDIIREVDEELRREDWEQVWKKYGKFVIGGAVALVLATAAVVGWREYDKSQRMAQGSRFAEAVARAENAAVPAEAADVMAATARDATTGYATLSGFREAKLRADAGDRGQAIAIYDAIASDTSVEPLLRDLATLYSVRMQIVEGDPSTLGARLAPLTAEANPWRYSAMELTAILALTGGDAEGARAIYAPLADDLEAPQTLRARAAEMLQALGDAG
ncbi:MAG: tetratricopeptide repeat protein [Rhodospirillales bacterium]|nr:MAG: tetratricopeptide repeat protein [Rhodospirillales bacterium]